MIASEKMRVKFEFEDREMRKPKGQIGPCWLNKGNQDDKIEEMSRIIKYLFNKLARMETERRRHDNRNLNQFGRPFKPPQVLQREKLIEDQPIQEPLKNENLVDNFVEEEFEELDEQMNMMEGYASYVHLNQDEYEKYLSFNQYFDEDDNKNQVDMSSSQYRIFSNALQYKLHKKYDLGPRENGTIKNNQDRSNKVQNNDKGKEDSSLK